MFICAGKQYRVTDKNGDEVFPGSLITDFRGDNAVMTTVTRGPEYNGTAKVLVNGSHGREFYAKVFDLTVTPVPTT